MPSVTLIARHRVQDYGAWRAAYGTGRAGVVGAPRIEIPAEAA